MAGTIEERDAGAAIQLLDQGTAGLLAARGRDHCVERLPAHGRLLATGDLHDNPIHLSKVLKLARLEESPDHHVVFHEVIHGDKLINGMDFSHRMIMKMARLVLEFPGQVHPMLANHELAQLTNRGVSKGAGNSVEQFDEAIDFIYGDEGDAVAEAVDRFMAAMPLAVITESGVLCAHSLPDAQAMERFDLEVFQRDLVPDDYLGPRGAAYLMTWGRRYTAESVATLAERWNVKLFCIGHARVEAGIELTAGNVIILNTDRENARVLPLDLANVPTPEEALFHAMPLVSVAV